MKKILFALMIGVLIAVFCMQIFFLNQSIKQYFDIESTQINQEAFEAFSLLKDFFDKRKIEISKDISSLNRLNKKELINNYKDYNIKKLNSKQGSYYLFSSNKNPYSFLLVIKSGEKYIAKKIPIRDNNMRYFSDMLQNGVNFVFFKNSPKFLKSKVFFDNKQREFFYTRDDDFVDIYLHVSGLSYIKISTHRSFYKLVKSSAYQNLIFSTIIIFIIFIMFYYLINRLILSKIWYISRQINKIEDNNDLSLRMKLKGKDEIAQLAIFIDDMLESVERAKKKEIEEKDRVIESERNFLQQIIDSSKNSLVVINKNNILKTNRSFHSIFGYIFNLSNEKRKNFINALLKANQDEIVNLKSNLNSQYSFFKIDKALLDLNQKHLITITDISSLGRQMEDLKKSSLLDPLTQVLNRKGMLSLLAQNYKNKIFSLLLFDIDFFKKVNDTYGHPIGDKVLQSFAKILSQHSRRSDIVARIGGEEFVFISICDDTNTLKQTAERLRQKVEATQIEINPETSIKITVSIGGIICANYEKYDEYYKQADDNLYKAKEQGRNRSIISNIHANEIKI